jgi:hypothetical protein
MCPDIAGMQLKWGADVLGHVKIISMCESDEIYTDKTALIQNMIQSYSQITKPSV